MRLVDSQGRPLESFPSGRTNGAYQLGGCPVPQPDNLTIVLDEETAISQEDG